MFPVFSVARVGVLAAMPSVILLAIMASLSIPTLLLSDASQDCPQWKAIVQSPGFQRYLLAAAGSARIDIAVPKSFDQNDISLLNQLLMRTPVSVRSFSLEDGFCVGYGCLKVRNDRRVLVVIICRSSFWKVLWNVFANPYVAYLCIVAANYDNVTNFSSQQHMMKHYYVNRIRGSGVFNFTVSSGHTILTVHNEEHCLDCSEAPEALLPRRKNLPLSAVEVRVGCLHPYVCEDPAFEMLGELVRCQNASFRAVEFGMNRTPIYEAAAETHLYPVAMLYFPTLALAGWMSPGTVVPCYYSDAGYSFFVKGLKPYSKEMVLLLPFSLPVWLISLICFVACLVITLLIGRILGGSCRSVPIHPFVATLMSQSFSMSLRASSYQSFRLLLGVWIIASFVMSVVFRSNLTSLLNEVPLEGEMFVFKSLGYLQSQRFRICILSYTEELVIAGTSAGQHVQMGNPCFDSSRRIRIRSDGRDTFLVYNSGSKKHALLKRELLSRGYVQTTTKVLSYTSGPEIRAASPYRRAIWKLLSRSHEGGLFDRAVRMATFEFPSQREADHATPENYEEPLTVNSLRPYFFLWMLGIIISTLVFGAECLAHRYNRRNTSLVRHQ